MSPSTNLTTHDPFGGLLADVADPATDPLRRLALSEQLLVAEAEELAHGWRHLTVVHGDPTDLAASRQLSAFYDTLPQLDACGPVRICGNIIGYVTITVGGSYADERIAALAAAARVADPGDWTIVAAAYPPEALS